MIIATCQLTAPSDRIGSGQIRSHELHLTLHSRDSRKTIPSKHGKYSSTTGTPSLKTFTGTDDTRRQKETSRGRVKNRRRNKKTSSKRAGTFHQHSTRQGPNGWHGFSMLSLVKVLIILRTGQYIYTGCISTLYCRKSRSNDNECIAPGNRWKLNRGMTSSL